MQWWAYVLQNNVRKAKTIAGCIRVVFGPPCAILMRNKVSSPERYFCLPERISVLLGLSSMEVLLFLRLNKQ